MPVSIWENRHKSKASVLFWIPGGGFDVGWKDASGAGEGLVARSVEDGREGVILVSINYRLGIFGWMHGTGVTSNAGLLDQRFALEWVQAHIGRFGGDKSKVTILAESAGAGSAMAHITAYGGADDSPPPFIGAIIQSPYLPPKHLGPESSVDGILKYGNIASVDALRAKSSEELQLLNASVVGNAKPFGNFVFGIVIDGDYVPDLPSRLLLQFCFDKNISVMTGHVQDEGSLFVPNSQVTNEQQYREFLMATFPSLATSPPTQLDVLTKKLYPPIFDGSQGYTNQTERKNVTIADAMIVCNACSLNIACFDSIGYAYEYTVPHAVHGVDLAYTFYDGPSSSGEVGDVNATVATILQKYITNFAQGADPNGSSNTNFPYFPPLGAGRIIRKIGIEGIGPKVDEGGGEQVEARRMFWQNAPYLE